MTLSAAIMRSACDSPANSSVEHLFALFVVRKLAMCRFELVQRGGDRGHVACDAAIAEEGSVGRRTADSR